MGSWSKTGDRGLNRHCGFADGNTCRCFWWILLTAIGMGLVFSANPTRADQGRWLAREQILLYGLGLKVEPEHQTVPKDIATIVSTYLQAPAMPPSSLFPSPKDVEVRATLRGPSLSSPVQLVTPLNEPFEIPPLQRAGLHSLDNIRVVQGGKVLFYGVPESVTIQVIEQLLVTEVTARALTATEIREKGIAFDQTNFQAYNFTAAFAVKPGEEIKINFPVLLPKLAPVQDVSLAVAKIPGIRGPVLQKVSTILPDTLKIAQTQIPNLTVRGFTLGVEELQQQGLSIPPIPGVIVIPGDIGFLNQYFSVMLMVGNVAPEGSGLIVENLQAEIALPPGNDTVVGSGDDPLRMAVTEKGVWPGTQPIAKPGPDGKLGTADDEDSLGPGESGNAEFLVEGRREGSHVVEMEITGTLTGLPVGPVAIRGRAAGAVLVRNPSFTLTFTHPEIVNDGEEYDLDVTITNTSQSPANFVSVNLYPRNISGASLVNPEDNTREIESIPTEDSATVSFRLRSKVTGTVYASTLDSDEKVAGRFELKTVVGELGIPLSPDSLVLPKEAASLPLDLRRAAVGLLGKAYATATAPASSLPKDVMRFTKKMVWDRAVEVAEAGLRYTLHEPLGDTAKHLLMDVMGNGYARLAEKYPGEEQQNDLEAAQKDFVGFDDLRRRSFRGDVLADAFSAILAEDLQALGALSFHRDFAETVSYRPQHLSVLIMADQAGESLPYRLVLLDDQGRMLGQEDEEKVLKEIPFSDSLTFENAQAQVYAQMALVSVPQGTGYTIRLRRTAPTPGPVTLSVVLPAQTESGLRQVVFSGLTADLIPVVPSATGDPFTLSVEIYSEAGPVSGIPALPTSGATIPDLLPTVISAVQRAEADIVPCHGTGGPQLGRVVAVLFSEEVTAESAQDQFDRMAITNYKPEENETVGVALQPGGRIAYLALRDSLGPFIERQLIVSGVSSLAGQVMEPWTGVMEPTITEEGAVLSGKILHPDGTPVDSPEVRLYFWNGECGWYGVSAKNANTRGEYGWDFVLKNPKGRIVVVDPSTEEFRAVEFKAARHGQRLNINVVFLGRATLQGRTFAEDGFTPLAETQLRVTSMTDYSSYGAKTDEQGRFTVPGIPVGGILIEAVHVKSNSQVTQSDYLPVTGKAYERDLVLLSEPTRVITIKYGALSGHVLESDGTTPVSGLPVVVYYRTESQEGVACPPPCGPPNWDCAVAFATTDDNGAFAFEEIPAGALRVYTYDPSRFIEGEARMDLPEEGEAKVNVLLSGGLGTVRGIVLDADGNPVAGAAVGGGMSLVTTNAEGIFELKDVPVGNRKIVAVSEALGSLGQAEVDLLAEGEEIYATVVLKPTGSVTGTVYQPDGVTPVPNLEVYLWEPAEDANIYVVATAVTDAEGHYRMEKVPVSTGYKVSAFLPDMSKGNAIPAPIQFHRQVVRADITFIGKGTIRGVVYDDDGATPLKAQVSLSGLVLRRAGPVGLGFEYVQHARIVENDFSTGEFVFQNVFVGPFTVATGGHFNLMCKTVDVAGSPQDVLDPISFSGILPQDGAEVFATLQLQPTSQIRGTVYQPDGTTPVGEGVKVTFRGYKIVCYPMSGCFELPHGIQEETVVTDKNGQYWLPLVNPWKFEVRAEDPVTARIGQERGLVLPGETAEIPIRLLGRGDVTVRVYGSDGVSPIPNADVTVKHAVILDVEGGLANNKGTLDIERHGTADEGGEITFDGGDALPEGEFVVLARDLNTGFAGRASGRVTGDGQLVQVNVYLFNATGSVYGTIYRYDRVTPVPNAEVLISNPSGTLGSCITDEQGNFRFDLLPLGAFEIRVFEAATGGRGYGSAGVDYANQEVPLNIILSPIGYVTGTALASGTLEPLKGWEVTIRQPNPGASGEWTVWRGTTGTDGGFSFPGISVGAFTLKVEKGLDRANVEGRITWQGETVDIPVVVNLVQDPEGTIAGVIYNPNGTPAANAEVCLNACPPLSGGRGTTSDDQGNFVFEGVDLGRYKVIGRSQATEERGRSLAELAFAGETTYVSVVLSGLGTISGHVERQDGTAAPYVEVILTSSPPICEDPPCSRYADENGDFQFENVPAGRYTVEAAWSSDLSGSAGGILAPGETAELRLVMQPAFILSGRVLFSNQAPAQGILATLDLMRGRPTNPNIPWILYGETDPEGRVAFRGVPTGSCKLILEDPLGPGIAQKTLTVLAPVDLGNIVLDDTLPQVTAMQPMAGAVNVPLGQVIRIRFSESVNPGTVNQESVIVTRGDGTVVLGTRGITEGDTLLTFTPLQPLQDEARYTVRISANPAFDTLDTDRSGSVSRVEAARFYAVLVRFDGYDANKDNSLSKAEYPDGVQDYLGHVMEKDFVASFTTVDITPPAYKDVSPAPGTGGVSVNSVIRIVFSEPLDPSAFVGPAVALFKDGFPVEGRVDMILGNTGAVFTPKYPLSEDAQYQVSVPPAADLSGNVQAEGLQYLFTTTDRTPPQVQSLSLSDNGTVVEGGVGTLAVDVGSAYDISFMDFYINGVLVLTDRQPPFQMNFEAVAQLGAPAQTITVGAVATDTSGNRGAVLQGTFTIVADTPPAVAIVNPATGLQARTGDRVEVSVTAQDDLGVATLAYQAAGGQHPAFGTIQVDPAASPAGAAFSFFVPVQAVPGSTIRVEATAVDTRGQQGQAVPVEVVVLDATDPTVSFAGLSTGEKVKPGDTVTVVLSAQDLGGVTALTLSASGAATFSETRQISPAANSAAATFTFTMPPSAGPGQSVLLEASAQDLAGNQAERGVTLAVADTVAPTIVRIENESGSAEVAPAEQVSILVEASDQGMLSRIELRATGAFVFSDARQVSPPSAGAVATFTLPLPESLEDGDTIQLEATAVDSAGNTSLPEALTLTVRSLLGVTLPASHIMLAGETQEIALELSGPAPTGGVRVDLTVDDPSVAIAPPSVQIPEGEISGAFSLKAFKGGTTTLSASMQGTPRADMTLTVRGGVVTGTVYVRIGQDLTPVSGTDMNINGKTTKTDAQGRFMVEGVAGTRVEIRAFDPVTRLRDYETGTMNVAGGYLRDVILVLVPAGAIVGTAVHQDGQTLAGEGVRVDLYPSPHGSWQDPIQTVFTNAESRFEFPLVEIGVYDVETSDVNGNRGRARVTISESGQEIDVLVAYLGRGSVHVTVKDAGGRPVPNAELSFNTTSIFGAEYLTATAALDGTYTFEGVFIGDFAVTAKDPVTQMGATGEGNVTSHGQVVEITLEVGEWASLEGFVVRADGTTPIVGAQVSTWGGRTETDENGHYRFELLRLGNHPVEAKELLSRAYGEAVIVLATNGQTEHLDIVCFGQGTLIVTVEDAQGRVVSGASIRMTENPPTVVDAMTNEDGLAVIEKINKGAFTLKAESAGLSGIYEGTIAEEETLEITVTLEETGTLSGVVYQPYGVTPVETVQVKAMAQNVGFFYAITGPDGRFTFENMPRFTRYAAGIAEYSLEAYEGGTVQANGSYVGGQLRAKVEGLVIESQGEEVEQDLVLIGLGTVEGQVWIPGGQATAPDMPVTLRSLTPVFGKTYSTRTDGAGFYHVDRVPVGDFIVSSGDLTQQVWGEVEGAVTDHGELVDDADILLASNVVTLPKNLYDGNLTRFDIQTDGTIKDGQSNLFTQYSTYGLKGGMALAILSGGNTYAFEGNQASLPATEENLKREIAVRQNDLGGLNVTRKIYVPQEGYFARYLEILTNPTAQDITVDLRVASNFYYTNGNVHVVTTSSGDAALQVDGTEASDRWVVVDDNNDTDPFVSSNLPPAAFVWSGPGDTVRPDGATFTARTGNSSPANLTMQWSQVTVPAGQSVAFMHFVAQQVSRLGAQASAERLIQLPPEALYGLGLEEMSTVQNFAIPEDGTSALQPLPRLTGQVSGDVYASDGVTLAPNSSTSKVYVKSDNLFFGRTYSTDMSYTGTGRYALVSDLNVPPGYSNSGYMGIPLDSFTLWAEVSRSATVTSPVVSSEFPAGVSAVEVDLIFSNTGIFRGTVRKATGEVVSGAKVTARMQPYYAETTTAADGTYQLAFLPPGQYAVEGAYSTYPQITTSVSAGILEGQATVLDITFPPVGNVSGVVTSSTGSLLSGATVRLEAGYPNASTFYRQTTTDTSGRFTFTEIPEGYYTFKIYVGSVSSGTVIQALEVAANQTLTHDVQMPQFITLPLNLNDANGFLWDVRDSGLIYTGTSNAYYYSSTYRGGLALSYAAATSYTNFTGDTYDKAAPEDEGRELLIGYNNYSALRVSRKVFVPDDDAFVRYLEIFENTDSSAVPLKVKLSSSLGSYPNTVIVDTSSGNRIFDTSDGYIVTDDADGSGTPAMVHVFAGPGAPVGVSEAVFSNSSVTNMFNYSFNITVPAYGRTIVMHFASQNASRANALDSADKIYCLLGSTLAGLSQEEKADIINFVPVPDSDRDGLNDEQEVIHGTYPNNPDTDEDGLLDGFEVMYGFDPLVIGEEDENPDGDGLDNLTEQQYGTHPRVADTDGGGLTDGDEVTEYETDPLDPRDDTFPLPIILLDQVGYRWDIQSNGSILDGSANAYDSAMRLIVGTHSFPNFSHALAREDKGREIVIGPDNYGSLKINRKIFVPKDDAFVRYLDIFENTGTSELTYTVRILTDLGANTSTSYVTTSSGDSGFTVGDNYILTDDADGTGTPTTVQVFSGANAKIEPYLVSTNAPGNDDIEVQFRLVIPAGERMILMHFASQSPDRATALASAEHLYNLNGSTLAGLSDDERKDIVNFTGWRDGDGDGLFDYREELYGTDPNDPDTDDDGLTDYFEVTYRLNPLIAGEQNQDQDQDDLTNLEEQAAGSDPRLADTDSDGLTDGEEVVQFHTDPTSAEIRFRNPGTGYSVEAMPATDLLGNIHIVWSDSRTGNYEIFYTMLSPGGRVLIDDTALTNDSAASRNPALAVDGQNRVHVFWEDARSGVAEIFHTLLDPYLHSLDGSAASDAAIRVVEDQLISPNDGISSYRPMPAIDGQDRVHVVFYDESGGTLHYARVNADGVPEITGRTLFVVGQYYHTLRPAVAVDVYGRVHVVWRHYSDNSDVYYTMLDGDTARVLIGATVIATKEYPGQAHQWVGVGPDAKVTVVYDGADVYADPLPTQVTMLRLAPSLDDQDGTPADAAQITVLAEKVLSPADGKIHGYPMGAREDGDKMRLTHYIGDPWDEVQLQFQIVDHAGATGGDILLTQEPTVKSPLNDRSAARIAVDGIASFVTWTDVRFGGQEVLLRILHPDTDRDGLTNDDERIIHTDPSNADTDGDGLLDGFEVEHGFDPLVHGEQEGDPDADALTNLEEQAVGSDPGNLDTDGDGLGDGAEVKIHGSDPTRVDTDGDGLGDGEEVNTYSTDPVKADTDDDGLSDKTEIQYGLNPNNGTDASADFDSDGLNNAEEIALKTNLNLADTDGDGLSDGLEVNTHFTDPLDADSDDDGLTDGAEVLTHLTLPLNPDTDQDGLSDGDEVTVHQSSPLDGDTDDGGRGDGEEVLKDGTDPTDGSDDEIFVPITEGAGIAGAASAATDSQGNIHLAWVDNRTGSKEIFYTMADPGGVILIDDTQLSNGSVMAGRPVISVDSSDRVHVVWQDGQWIGEMGVYTEILHTVINPALDDRDGSAGSDAAMVVVDDQLVSSYDAQDPIRVSDPQIAADGQGRIHVLWSAWPQVDMGEYSAPFLEVHHAVMGADGQIEVDDDGVYQGVVPQWEPALPKVAVDSSDRAHLVWAGLDANGSNRIFYMMLDSVGTALIGATALTSETAAPRYPWVDVAPENKIVVVFESMQVGDQPYNVSMVTLDPSLVEHNGTAADPVILVTLGPIPVATGSISASMVPSPAVDGAGNVHLCYYGGDNEWSSRELLFKVVDQDGTTLVAERAVTEGATARSRSADTSEVLLPALAASSQGSYLVWTDVDPDGPLGVSDVMMRILHPMRP